MPETGFLNLFVVMLVALVAPLALGMVPRLRVPSVVVEILLGVLLGPEVLDLVKVDLVVGVVALIGLAFLLFMAGMEVDLRSLRGRSLMVAAAGFAISVALGTGVGLGAHAAGWVNDPLLLATTLSATSLGLVVPVLKDAGATDTPVSRTTIAAASIADLGSKLLLTLLFSTGSATVGARVVLLVTFFGTVILTGVALMSVQRWGRLSDVVRQLQDTTAEIRVRAAVVLLLAFVTLAEAFGLQAILGALLAGTLVAAVDRDSSTHSQFRTKIEALGYGFLVPVFFVASGMRLDVRGLFADPSTLLQMPVFLLALLLVRGLPALLDLGRLGRPSTAAVALLQATSLPFIVTATQIGVATGLFSGATAAALVAAGIMSVMVFPASALALLRRTPDEPDAPATAGEDVRRYPGPAPGPGRPPGR
ncbi:MAG: cation:proton antiporter [Nocardioidaceae bacterium]